MISWIQNHLIRHGRWIFLTLLAVIIVAFVFTIGNTPGCTTDRSGYEEQLFYGIDLNSPRESDAIAEKVQLSAFLRGQPLRSNEQFQNAVTNRIALLNLADEIGVPAPDQNTLADFITTKAAFRGEDGQFSADAYTAFVDQIESNPQTPQGLVLVVLEEDYRINQIGSALAGPGYLLPSEALAQTQRNRTEFSVATATIDYNAFSPEIGTNEEALMKYYEANKLRYEIPERIKASYAYFAANQYEDQLTAASEAELREHFITNRERFVAEYRARQTEEASGEETAVTFADVKETVVASLQLEQKSRIANEAAQTFAYTLYRNEIKRDSAAFKELLTASEVTLTEIEPYTITEARQRTLPADMLESALSLGGNRYYSDAYALNSGFAVLIYEGRISPEIPKFAEVEQEVIADFKAEEKRRLFDARGKSLKSELETQLAQGTVFAEAAEALELVVNSFDTFTIQDAPSELNRSALQKAQGMEAGELSSMLTSGPSGIFVYVKNKVIPEISNDDEDLTQAVDYLARFASFTTGGSYSNELVYRGLPADVIAEESE
ncbi:MAG: hypothetical protein ACPGGN_01535 [Opitutales bacterium]